MRVYFAAFAAAGFWCGLISGLTLTGEHGLREFESRVPRKIFGPKTDEITGGRRQLHEVYFRDLYSVPICSDRETLLKLHNDDIY